MTLLQLLRQMAHAAQETAYGAAQAARKRFLMEFDSAGDPNEATVAPVPGAPAQVPKIGLRDHRIMMPSEIEIEMETDVTVDEKADADDVEGLTAISVHLKRRRSLFRGRGAYAHMKVRARFAERTPPEGVHLVVERMDEHMRNTLHRAAVNAPLESLTPANPIAEE